MENDDIMLLKECNSGTKTATETMKQVLPYASDAGLKKLIETTLDSHSRLGDKCHLMLNEKGADEEDPSVASLTFAKLTTEVKLMLEGDDHKVADLMIDGCNMGIKSIAGKINMYKGSDKQVSQIAEDIIRSEQDFMKKLLKYL